MPNRPTADRLRAEPLRSAEFAHLSLDGLREYRRTLTREEGRVSYWRRIIQARLDLVRVTDEGGSTAVDNLRVVFAEERFAVGRMSLLALVPVDDIPPLPDLPGLWSREPVPGDHAHNARLAHDLSKAEAQLSAYRAALHRRLSAATSELIARYREQPDLCLSALPRQSSGARAIGL